MKIKHKIELIDLLSDIIYVNSQTPLAAKPAYSKRTVDLAEQALQSLLSDVIVAK